MSYEVKRVLLTVKAYPEKSKKYGACVCTAGITDTGEFIRLYPIPFESFRGGKKIPKYSWVTVQCEKASEYLDRKESFKVLYESLRVVSTISTGPNRTWSERNGLVLPHVSPSLEELELKSTKDNVSLGLINPRELTDMTIDTKHDVETSESEILKEIQITLDGESRTDLESIEYNFRYHFLCQNPECKGHNIMCEDWEMIESWRKWKTRYPDRKTLEQKFKERYLDYLMTRNLHFFVGTHSKFNTWLIIGLYYPPKAL